MGTNFTIYFQPEDFWFSAPKKGIMVFALPGEPGLTEVASDFKIQFHDATGISTGELQFFMIVLFP